MYLCAVKFRIAFLLTNLLFAASSFAQLNEEVWIIGGKKFLGDGFKEWKVDFVFDGRNSFADGEPIGVGGLRLGIEYFRVNRFGIGIYGLNQPVTRTNFMLGDANLDVANFTLSYATLYYERVLFFNPKWEISGTLHAGRGEVTINARNPLTTEWGPYGRVEVRPFELSSSAYHHLSWWLSVGAGVGYRWMLETPSELRDIYSSTVYLVKVKVRIGRAIRSIVDKDAKNEY